MCSYFKVELVFLDSWIKCNDSVKFYVKMLYYRTMIVSIILRIYPSMYDIASGASSALYDDWFFKKV